MTYTVSGGALNSAQPQPQPWQQEVDLACVKSCSNTSQVSNVILRNAAHPVVTSTKGTMDPEGRTCNTIVVTAGHCTHAELPLQRACFG